MLVLEIVANLAGAVDPAKKVPEAIREGQAETRHALKIDRERVIADLEAAYALAKAKGEPMGMVAAASCSRPRAAQAASAEGGKQCSQPM